MTAMPHDRAAIVRLLIEARADVSRYREREALLLDRARLTAADTALQIRRGNARIAERLRQHMAAGAVAVEAAHILATLPPDPDAARHCAELIHAIDGAA